ncbi:MAG: hypothetical protein Q8N45_09815 [Anaerolineales bacterium]|nr:hypothetical protein [Anaerolineales bacterium]
MRRPLEFIPNPSRKRIFIALLIWTLILFAIFQPLSAPLTTSAAPSGIVSFELARTPENAARMLDSWDERAQLFAAFGLGFDYLFMPSYALAIALGILMAAGRHPGAFAKIGAWLGWGLFAAAIFDAVENIALWNVLLGAANSAWPLLSYWCALFKFGLILLGIAYALAGWVWPKHK